jgi:hypothetical protein
MTKTRTSRAQAAAGFRAIAKPETVTLTLSRDEADMVLAAIYVLGAAPTTPEAQKARLRPIWTRLVNQIPGFRARKAA